MARIGFKEQKELFQLIGNECKRNIFAMIIGGSAMLFYNFQKKTTKDIDLVVFSEKDREYLTKTLERIGFKITYHPSRKDEQSKLEFKDYIVDIFMNRVFRMQLSEGIKDRIKEEIVFGNLTIALISPEDILMLKSMTDRQGDREDAASIIKEINVNWDSIIEECQWQMDNGNPASCVALKDFLDDIVSDYGTEIPRDVKKKVRKMYESVLERYLKKS